MQLTVESPRGRVAPRWLLALLIALALSFGAGAWIASEPASAQENAVEAVNTQDGSFLYSFSLDVRRATGEIVDESNSAFAYASCDECQALAVALQVVLGFSEPSVIAPTNLAVAVNEECTECATTALAYQYLMLGEGVAARFTGEGSARIAEIRRELRALGRAGLSFEETVTRAEGLIAELEAVLATELVPVGVGGKPSTEATDGAQETDGGAQTEPVEVDAAVAEPTVAQDPSAAGVSAPTVDEASSSETVEGPAVTEEEPSELPTETTTTEAATSSEEESASTTDSSAEPTATTAVEAGTEEPVGTVAEGE